MCGGLGHTLGRTMQPYLQVKQRGDPRLRRPPKMFGAAMRLWDIVDSVWNYVEHNMQHLANF